MKRWMKIAGIAAGLIAIAIVALFLLVNANTFRPLLEAQLTSALGRQVKLGNLRFAPFSGSLVANDLSVAGDPNYSDRPFLTAKELRIGVEMNPLIFSRQLRVRSFEIEEPQIHLVRAANGTWNFSTIGRNAASRTGNAQKESAIPNLTVGRIVIRNGSAVVENFPVSGRARVYDHLNFSARQVSFAKRFPFRLSASLPGDGEVSLIGNAGPINPQDAAMTALDAQISVKHLDPVVLGLLHASAGISMLADIDAHAISDGRIVNSAGTIHMQRLQLTKTGSPAGMPVEVVYDLTQNLQDKTGQLRGVDVNIGRVVIHLSGGYRLDPEDPSLDPSLNVTVNGTSLPIDELQGLMTSAGMKLPNGSVLRGGTFGINLSVVGPASNLVITGPVAIDNTRLVGFDLGSKISGIAALGGIKTGDTTSIQKLRLDLSANNAGLKIDNIDAVMPAVGEATGSGTVSPVGALAFRLVVKVTTASGLGKVGVGLLTKLNAMAGSTADAAAAKGVPMQVTGTASDPVITADVNGLMKRNASTIFGQAKRHNPGATLKSLFRKKK